MGKDRLVFEVAPTIPGGMVKLVEYKHLETCKAPLALARHREVTAAELFNVKNKQTR
ncbi:MAG: hypothetical protein LKI04_23510 [Paenibacillus lautus]|nr:hypothetical protein [Paenibacillus lautus]MCI1776982.1 hypothetical protein [Paenibacillus lautus]